VGPIGRAYVPNCRSLGAFRPGLVTSPWGLMWGLAPVSLWAARLPRLVVFRDDGPPAGRVGRRLSGVEGLVRVMAFAWPAVNVQRTEQWRLRLNPVAGWLCCRAGWWQSSPGGGFSSGGRQPLAGPAVSR